MIVTLKQPIKEKTDNYAYICKFGQPYFVYAILNSRDGSSYMINVYGGKNAYDIPASYFTILENVTPENWEEDDYDAYGEKVHIKTFPEMAHDKFFYDKLMNEDPETAKVFKKYAEQYEAIAQEFADRQSHHQK